MTQSFKTKCDNNIIIIISLEQMGKLSLVEQHITITLTPELMLMIPDIS